MICLNELCTLRVTSPHVIRSVGMELRLGPRRTPPPPRPPDPPPLHTAHTAQSFPSLPPLLSSLYRAPLRLPPALCSTHARTQGVEVGAPPSAPPSAPRLPPRLPPALPPRDTSQRRVTQPVGSGIPAGRGAVVAWDRGGGREGGREGAVVARAAPRASALRLGIDADRWFNRAPPHTCPLGGGGGGGEGEGE